MMSQHEDWRVKNGIVTPPAFPILVGPWAALWSELVTAHDFGSDTSSPVVGESLVGTVAAARISMHAAEKPGIQNRLKEPMSSMSEWLLERLSLTGTEAVERNSEVVNSYS